MAMIMIYVTHSDMDSAKKVVMPLLEEKLIACANLFPVKSAYLWKGKVEESDEVVSLLKSKEENWEKVRARVKELHPYDTPCIIRIAADADSRYLSWLDSELS